MLKFFSRCRHLANVLTVISVVIGIPVIFFYIFELDDLIKGHTELEYLLFIGLLTVLLITLIVIIIALRAIIKDAQEDVSAAMNYKTPESKE